MDYYLKGEYKKALPLLEKLANAGNINASYSLGEMYRKGNGVKENKGVSCDYYQKSAEDGNADAFFHAGVCAITIRQDNQRFKEAFKWFKKASEKLKETDLDEPDRKYLALVLANMYYTGKGTLQDFSEAARWFEKAGEMGDARAQGVLALLNYTGNGILSDKTKPRDWAEKAAGQGDVIGEQILGMLYQYSLPPEKNMQKAIEWYEKSAKHGSQAAQYQLAVIYENGDGVPKDLKKARYYYQEAAKGKYEEPKKAFAEFEKRQKDRK